MRSTKGNGRSCSTFRRGPRLSAVGPCSGFRPTGGWERCHGLCPWGSTSEDSAPGLIPVSLADLPGRFFCDVEAKSFSMKKYDLLTGLVWTISGTGISIESIRLGLGKFRVPGPGLLPFLSGCVLGFLGLILMYSVLSKGISLVTNLLYGTIKS